MLALDALRVAASMPSPFVFVNERGTPFTTADFARMIDCAARRLGLRTGSRISGWNQLIALQAMRRSASAAAHRRTGSLGDEAVVSKKVDYRSGPCSVWVKGTAVRP